MDRCLVPRGRWLQRGVWALAVVLLLVACGGGVGTGGTGAFASGPITGFGSIIVDGVHFDESAARIEGDDGSGRDRSELRLGTMVEVQSDEIRDGAATATLVRIASALIGRVESVGANGVVVNGVSVRVNAGTAIDDRFVGGLGGAVGQVVEVYGFVAPSEVVASRIEPDNGATAFKFRGVVTALGPQTFDIGSQHFVYPPTVSGSGELRNGAFVRVTVATQPDAQGRWVVSAVGSTGPGSVNRDQAKARGVITVWTSNANFLVGGFVVDASSAQIEGGPLASGLRVEVEGRLQTGVLIAAKVVVQDPNIPDEIDLHGVIATIDTGAKVFQLNVPGGRSERVSYARTDIVYDKGTAADLKKDRRVRVGGQLSADGTLVEATSIRFEGN